MYNLPFQQVGQSFLMVVIVYSLSIGRSKQVQLLLPNKFNNYCFRVRNIAASQSIKSRIRFSDSRMSRSPYLKGKKRKIKLPARDE